MPDWELAHVTGPGDYRLRAFAADDAEHDGQLLGRGRRSYPPGTPLHRVEGIRPADGRNEGRLLFVNGIRTDAEGQYATMQELANQSGMEVVGLHNATEGGFADVLQSVGDKADKGSNPAVDALADAVHRELQAGRPVSIAAHSQGALITSRALEDVRRMLQEDGLSTEAAEALLGHVDVETYGGAAWTYPDGPRYDHYVAENDLVADEFGLGTSNAWLTGGPLGAGYTVGKELAEHPGEGASVHTFRGAEGSLTDPQGPHSMHNYLQFRYGAGQGHGGGGGGSW